MGMTVIDFHPLADRLAALVAEGKWKKAAKQAALIEMLAKAVRKRAEKKAEEGDA